MTAVLAPVVRFREFDGDGNPLSGGKVYSYVAGTSTPKTTFSDAAGTIANPNPKILDANGRGQIRLKGAYKIVVTDANDTVIYTEDNIEAFSSPWVNVADLDVIGNGTTDDTAAIVAAGQAYDFLVFPEGSYRLSTTLSATQTNLWWLLPGAVFSVDSGVTLTTPSLQAGSEQHFTGLGTIVIPAKQVINPVWWTTAGTGVAGSVWTSTDGTAGFGGALAALQEYGTVQAPSGEYQMSATASVDRDNITLRFEGFAHIVPTADVRLFNLNSGSDPGDTATNNHSIIVDGGFFDTGSENSTLLATALYAPRCRNITFRNIRFRRLNCCIELPSADTMRIEECFFRTSTKGVYFPNYMHTEGATPQDIWILRNSISGEDDGTVMQFVLAESVISALHIQYNGAALGYNDAGSNTLGKFVQLVTGALDAADGVTEYESSNIHILDNATEQAGDNAAPTVRQTLVRIYDTGSLLDCSDVYIEKNDFGSPYAKILDLNRMAGAIHIRGNQFQHAGAFAIDLDQVRPDAIVLIEGNKFLQDGSGANPGVQWDITNVITTGQVFIGRNSMVQASGTIGLMTHPTTGRVNFTQTGAAINAVTAAASISIRPWISSFAISGAGNVDTLAVTWEGHEVMCQVGAGVTLRDDSTGGGNFKFRSNADIVGGTNVFVKLYTNGTSWFQITDAVTL